MSWVVLVDIAAVAVGAEDDKKIHQLIIFVAVFSESLLLIAECAANYHLLFVIDVSTGWGWCDIKFILIIFTKRTGTGIGICLRVI